MKSSVSNHKDIYILSALRTPIGSYLGGLANLCAVDLGKTVISELLARSGTSGEQVESVVMGNVLSAGLGQGPSRQAALRAGLSFRARATTVNKVCSSGMKAISILSNEIKLGETEIGVAGGMESMSQVPFYLTNSRPGMKFGNKILVDGLLHDGLTDPSDQTVMGSFADRAAKMYQIERFQLDDYAQMSYEKAKIAWSAGFFQDEVVQVCLNGKNGEDNFFLKDEEFIKFDAEKMRNLKPAFTAGGCVTAANASSMSDGASALLLCGDNFLKESGISPLARVVGYAEAEQEPHLFFSTPVLAAEKVLSQSGLSADEISLWEVNEAFAVVPLVFNQKFNIPFDKLNVNGGAIALGHPLGASGARIVTTLVHALKNRGGRYGLAAICNGGGGASAIIVEVLN